MTIDRKTGSAKDSVTALTSRINDLIPDFNSLRMRIDDWLRISSTEIDSLYETVIVNLDGLQKRLSSLSPAETMERGYAIVENPVNSEVVMDSSVLSKKDKAKINLARGAFTAEVISILEAD